MNSNFIALLAAILAVVIVIGGVVWLGRGSSMPPVQKVEQVIPDDRIAR